MGGCGLTGSEGADRPSAGLQRTLTSWTYTLAGGQDPARPLWLLEPKTVTQLRSNCSSTTTSRLCSGSWFA